MSNDSPSGACRPAVFDLSPEVVGQIVLKLGAVAAHLNHQTVQATLRDYIHPDSQELEFVRDLFVRPVSEITDRWYGNRIEASALAVNAVVATLAS